MRSTISREMTIEEIFSSFPQRAQKLAQAITDAGLHCVGCQAATWETLEAGMLGHGYKEEEIDRLVEDLNAILSEQIDASTIALTKRAAEKFQEILKEEGKPHWHLRFGDEAAGCSGFTYILDYSEKATDEDDIFHSHGVQIHVKKKMVPRLLGSQIDYIENSLNHSGFKVSNLNARGSCGCGKSQSY